MVRKFSFISLSVICLSFFASCGGGNVDTATDENADADSMAVTEVDNSDSKEELLQTLPSPLQIASIFRRSGLEYVPGVTNGFDNVSKYNTKVVQKLNFGVYSTDLAYSALNEQNQDCINYIKSISELSEKLWLTNIFTSISILDRFENNLGDSDSMSYILSDFQMDLDSYLEENGLSQNSILIFAGAWVESMYIALKSLEQNPNTKLAARLIEQKKIINSLVKIIESDDSEYMKEFLSQLNTVKSHFDRVTDLDEIVDTETLEEQAFTAEEQNNLLSDVESVRNKIVNG